MDVVANLQNSFWIHIRTSIKITKIINNMRWNIWHIIIPDIIDEQSLNMRLGNLNFSMRVENFGALISLFMPSHFAQSLQKSYCNWETWRTSTFATASASNNSFIIPNIGISSWIEARDSRALSKRLWILPKIFQLQLFKWDFSNRNFLVTINIGQLWQWTENGKDQKVGTAKRS